MAVGGRRDERTRASRLRECDAITKRMTLIHRTSLRQQCPAGRRPGHGRTTAFHVKRPMAVNVYSLLGRRAIAVRHGRVDGPDQRAQLAQLGRVRLETGGDVIIQQLLDGDHPLH